MTLSEAVSAARHADPRPFIVRKRGDTVLSIVGVHLYYTDESGVKGMYVPDACDLWGDTEWELRNTLNAEEPAASEEERVISGLAGVTRILDLAESKYAPLWEVLHARCVESAPSELNEITACSVLHFANHAKFDIGTALGDLRILNLYIRENKKGLFEPRD